MRKIMKKPSLNDSAQDWAEYCAENLMHFHRGCAKRPRWDAISGRAVFFGNDNYRTDVRSQKEVVALRGKLRELGGREIDFGVASNGTWAIRVWINDSATQTMCETLSSAWFEASGVP